MIRIYTAKQQKQIEEAADRYGVGEVVLMENAGARAFMAIKQQFEVRDAVIPILCGPGGNGGDGLVVARMLKQAGAHPLVVLCGETPHKGAAALMYKRTVVDGVPIADLAFDAERIVESLGGAALIVDAVFGIGFHGGLEPELAELFSSVNKSAAKVISLDVPSGVYSDSCDAAEGAIRADLTLCFVGFKPANVMKCCAAHCGRSVLVEVGVPKQAYDAVKSSMFGLNAEVASPLLSPKNQTAHKGSSGKLVVVAGSDRYRGAAVMATIGAYRAGAGLVTVASGEKTLEAVAAHCPEAILMEYKNEQFQLAERLTSGAACVFGCGLGANDQNRQLLEMAIKAPGLLVLDADGINMLANSIELLKERTAGTILTPHLGEFARLTGRTVEEVAKDRAQLAAQFAREHGVVLVLKSENTVVATPTGKVFVNMAGNPGLAKAGTGDLLAGVIGAYCAMGKTALDAALLGVYVHSHAADLAVQDIQPYSLLATDVAGYIPEAVTALLECV